MWKGAQQTPNTATTIAKGLGQRERARLSTAACCFFYINEFVLPFFNFTRKYKLDRDGKDAEMD